MTREQVARLIAERQTELGPPDTWEAAVEWERVTDGTSFDELRRAVDDVSRSLNSKDRNVTDRALVNVAAVVLTWLESR